MKRFRLYNAPYHKQQHSNWLYWYWLVYWYGCLVSLGFSAKNVDLVEMDAASSAARKAAFDAFYARDRFVETISFLVGGAHIEPRHFLSEFSKNLFQLMIVVWKRFRFHAFPDGVLPAIVERK